MHKLFFFLFFLLSFFTIEQVQAVVILNRDTAEHRLLVRGDKGRYEIILKSGEKFEFCSKGCFVTFPDGDCHALIGAEIVEILQGKANIL